MPSSDLPAVSHAARGEPGSITPLLIACTLLLSVALAGAAALLDRTRRELDAAAARAEEIAELETVAQSIVAALAEDPTPDADSSFDPVWSRVVSNDNRISLEEISSRLNLNTFPDELFSLDECSALFSPGAPVEEFLRVRSTTGLFSTTESSSEYFAPEAPASLFTVYGYVNPNMSSRAIVERFLACRMGPADAALLAGELTAATGDAPLTREELKTITDQCEGELWPLFCIEPPLNVNMAPQTVLRIAAAYLLRAESASRQAEALADALIDARTAREVDGGELRAILTAKGAGSAALQLFGTRSWFWRITVAGPRLALTRVVCRLPGEGGRRFALLENRLVHTLEGGGRR